MIRWRDLGWTAACAIFGLACSAGQRHSLSGSGQSGPSASATTGAGGNNTSSTGTSLGGSFNSGSGGGQQTAGCSADLRYVVDGMGNTLQDCWPNNGCDGGMCVDPCKAAADSKGNVGCQFVLATSHFFAGIAPPCFAAFAANNWPRAAKLTVSRGGQTFDVTQFGRIAQPTPPNDPDPKGDAASWPPISGTGVPQGKVGVLFLSHDPSSVNGTPLACPVEPAVSGPGGAAVWMGPNGDDSGIGQAWKITSDTPVSLYDIIPYGGAQSFLPSAELVLPVTAWGTNYVAVLPKKPDPGHGFDPNGPPWGQLTASQTTTIKILPTIDLPPAGSVPGAPANKTTTFTLQAGQFVQWQTSDDFTGTIIQSNPPVSFTGGNGYSCYASKTSSGGGCDSSHQMNLPISALGSEYVMPPYHDRSGSPESIPYRVIGAVAGTKLTFDPPAAGAPASLGVGQYVDFELVGAYVIKSQDKDHPFYLAQLMPGDNGIGDEDFVNILPPAEFLSKYVFFTDPTYPTTNLVFVRVKDSAFKDVKLDCLGTITCWQAVGGSGKYQITNVDLIRDNNPNGNCNNGPQAASSAGRFGVMVWGLATYSSYAYPAGGSVAPINTVVVPPTPK